MNRLTRRDVLRSSSLASIAAWSWTLGGESCDSVGAEADLQLSTFQFDVTPPIGHSCCGGWIKPVEVVDDSLEAIGLVLTGAGKPIVLCAVDWTGLLNEAHLQWRQALAKAVGTTPDRVAVHCVHQHNAPFACLDAQRIVAAYSELPAIVDTKFFSECLERGAAAAKASLSSARPITHIGTAQAKVEKVASNRRVARNAEGRITRMRGSSCRDESLRAMPEGLIDPMLRSVAFFSGDEKLAVCHYYATHPMSYYADGRVSSDFVGLARKQLQQEQPNCRHLYFTGCAGNIAAGKYNDGSHEARPLLTQRVYRAMSAADEKLTRTPINGLTWRTQELMPKANEIFVADAIRRQIADEGQSTVNRNRPAYTLAWLERMERQEPIVLSSLELGNVSWLHLPAECFVQYQLAAQQMAPDRFVLTAAYGDGGPWYIPIANEYDAGGYEVSVAFCAPSVEDNLRRAMGRLLDANVED